MAYEMSWQQDKRVVLGRIYGNNGLEDVDRWSQEILTYLETGTEPVHLVIDSTAVKTIPTNITALKGSMKYVNHPKLGWNVIIGGPAVVHVFAQLISRIAGIRYKAVRDLESAVDFLQTADVSLTSQ